MRDFQGPCMCGDPYCPHCGDPSLAQLEDLCDEFLELIRNISVDEAKAVMINARVFVESLKLISPLLASGIVQNIGEVAAQAHENLRKEAESLGLDDDDPSTDEGF